MDAPRQITYEQLPPIERPRRSGMAGIYVA